MENSTKRNVKNLIWSATGDLVNLGTTGLIGDLSDVAKIIRQTKYFPGCYNKNLYKNMHLSLTNTNDKTGLK